MLTAWGREKIWMLLGEKEAAVFRVTWCGTRLTDELKTDSRDDISCHSAVCWWWAAATRTKAAVLAPSRSTSQSDSHCVALVSSSEPVPGYRTTEDKSWDICRNKMLHSKTLSLKGLFCGNQTPPRRQKAFTAFRVTHKKKKCLKWWHRMHNQHTSLLLKKQVRGRTSVILSTWIKCEGRGFRYLTQSHCPSCAVWFASCRTR